MIISWSSAPDRRLTSHRPGYRVCSRTTSPPFARPFGLPRRPLHVRFAPVPVQMLQRLLWGNGDDAIAQADIPDNVAIPHLDHQGDAVSDRLIVGDEDQHLAELPSLFKQPQDLLAGGAVEVASRFVG